MTYINLNEENQINELMFKYELALEMLQTKLNILIREYEFAYNYNPVEHVKSRLKTVDSAIEKLEKKGYEINTTNIMKHIHDMIGIRIVCSFIPDVYNIAGSIKSSHEFVIKEEKDYIQNPKETGYISYHLIVLVPISFNGRTEYVEAEIQIRTIAMDFWASLDHKITYKFPKEIPEEVKKEMYNCAMDIKTLDSKMYELNKIVQKYND
jgi:putative GTP pyrophosphokinase